MLSKMRCFGQKCGGRGNEIEPNVVRRLCFLAFFIACWTLLIYCPLSLCASLFTFYKDLSRY